MTFWHSKRERRVETMVLNWSEVPAALAEPEEEIQPMEIGLPPNHLLAQLSDGLSAAAIQIHNVELARLGRKAAAASQFREMLDNLKGQIARRAVTRTGHGPLISSLEIPSEAA